MSEGQRISWGEDHPTSKLTEEQVRAIRRRLARGETEAQLAREHRVHRATISLIKRGKTWTRLED